MQASAPHSSCRALAEGAEMEAVLKEEKKQERLQLKVPSESFRVKEMSRKLGNLYRAWVDAGRPMRDVGERP